MRLAVPRPPLRLLIIVLVGWLALRVYVLWPERQAALAQQVRQAERMLAPFLHLPEIAPARDSPVRHIARRFIAPSRVVDLDISTPASSAQSAIGATPTVAAPLPSAQAEPRTATTPVPRAPDQRWSGWAYLFARPGGARSLASQGQIGGSQAAARIAYRVTGPVSVALRTYTPLHDRGAEAALGVDLALPANAHLVVERRMGLDRAGRDAWSAYASGGFYRELGALIADGYAQAGVVGARRRDAFVDGAVRIGRRFAVAGMPVTMGLGTWGAAQPGAARVDVGPRLALQLPVAKHTATLSLDGRFRIAGHARPGSGLALTLGTDF